MTKKRIHILHAGQLIPQEITLPEERIFCISVNGKPIIRLAATPSALEALAIGFLYDNGYIQAREEIAVLHLSEDGRCADIWLTHDVATMEGPPLLTSGCGQGVVMSESYVPLAPLTDSLCLDATLLPQMLHTMLRAASIYRQSRGIHVSALFTLQGRLLAIAEDIGRHNTLDKLLGQLVQAARSADEAVLLTTGRISSEMIGKAARMQLPIVATLKTLSSLAGEMAEAGGITALGHIATSRPRLYTHPHRVRLVAQSAPPPRPTPADG